MRSENPSVSRVSSPLSWPRLAAISLGILAVITSVWAVRSQNSVEVLERELAQIRAGTGASVFDLVATDLAPDNAQGQVFVSLAGSGAVIVSGLPQPGDNEVFILWYLQDDGSAISGGTLQLQENGAGFALIPGDTGNYSHIAISLEAAGSDAPAGNYLLVAEVKSGRG